MSSWVWARSVVRSFMSWPSRVELFCCLRLGKGADPPGTPQKLNVKTSRSYLLAVLTAIFSFNYTDRFALGISAQNIKTDLALSDTQLGLLSGMAFALFYAVAGIPMARWADRGNRVT